MRRRLPLLALVGAAVTLAGAAIALITKKGTATTAAHAGI